MTTTDLRFNKPPVRAVELSIFFEQVDLRLTSIATIVTSLQEDYPHSSEEFARPPWVLESNGATFATIIQENSEEFPFPWLTFRNDSGQSISFQADRIVLRWEFDETYNYPGYIKLKEYLESFFDEFHEHASQLLNEEVVIRRTRAEYVNKTGTEISWTVSQQAARQTHDLIKTAPIDGLLSTNSGGFFQFHDGELITNVEYAALSEPDGGNLSLRSTASLNEVDDSENSIDWKMAIDTAHDHLIDCFALLTTPEQKLEWERQ